MARFPLFSCLFLAYLATYLHSLLYLHHNVLRLLILKAMQTNDEVKRGMYRYTQILAETQITSNCQAQASSFHIGCIRFTLPIGSFRSPGLF